MTIRIPEINIIDKLLTTMGKRRAVYIPEDTVQKPYGVCSARKESFLRTVLRSKNETLPAGWHYLDSFEDIKP